jgi:catechol 2,3-dioxygenase-like lactoylglutathione lyase family enzyme
VISGLNHITLSVRNIDRSFRFYVDTLGAKPLARWSKGAYPLAGDAWLCLALDALMRSSPPPEYSSTRPRRRKTNSPTRARTSIAFEVGGAAMA